MKTIEVIYNSANSLYINIPQKSDGSGFPFEDVDGIFYTLQYVKEYDIVSKINFSDIKSFRFGDYK